jgi:hypothetical protein
VLRLGDFDRKPPGKNTGPHRVYFTLQLSLPWLQPSADREGSRCFFSQGAAPISPKRSTASADLRN